MIRSRKSLLQSLFGSLILPGVVVMSVSLLIVYHVFKDEYDELLDASLIGKAHLLLDVIETIEPTTGALDKGVASLLAYERDLRKPEERTLVWYLDATGEVFTQTGPAEETMLPVPLVPGLSTERGYRFMVLASKQPTLGTVVLAEPMVERNEAITDVVISAVVGFGFLGVLFAISSFLALRRSVAMIADLSRNIAERNEHNLAPIDRDNAFSEITPAIDTLDGLMARLDRALSAERAFATNAAHELRTPVAISLANVQRLRAQLSDANQANSAVEIEAGLKRLVRLIERLLQMSRAQSGLGLNAVAQDVNPVISMLIDELHARSSDPDRLVLKRPLGAWHSRIDPDALGIILNNLFDNALKYASGPGPTVVDASQPGQVVVSNDCEPLSPTDMEAIKQRFIRRAALSDGYGLGLAIAQELCGQAGCRLQIFSPRQGSARGFVAVVILPEDGAAKA